MKKLFRKLIFIGAGVVLFASCKKDQSMEYFNGGTAPVVSSSVTGTIPLSYANSSLNAVTFNWTNPNYQFASGISSQDVSYLLEIDTLGANFTNPNRLTQTISKDLGVTFTQSAFNSILLNQMYLVPGIKHTIQVRITSSISSVTATNAVSNVLQFTVTPFQIPPVITPPASGKLFLVGGDSKLGAWANPVPVPAQQFTQVSSTMYTITIALAGDGNYDFIPVNGSWSEKYCVTDATIAGLSAGGSFVDLFSGGSDIPGPGVAGTYKIVVDFQHGKFTTTKQ